MKLRKGAVLLTCKTHEAFGILTAEAALGLTTEVSAPVFIGTLIISAYAALIPDIDTPNSKISHNIFLKILFLPYRIIHGLLVLLSKISGLRKSGVKSAARATGHRGMFHSPVIWLIILPPLFWLLKSTLSAEWFTTLSIGTICGIASHLLGDMVFGGIPILYPITDKKYRLSPLTTDSLAEYVVLMIMVIADITLAIRFMKG